MTESMWPDFYPDDCPPEDCEDCAGRFYRIIQKEKPTDEDFIPYSLAFPEKPYFQKCKAAGLSLCITLEAARTKLEQTKFEGQFIAVLELPVATGKMKKAAQSSHVTWWVPRDISPLDFVREVVIT